MQLITMEARKGMAETTGLSTALPGLVDYYIRDFAWGPNAKTSIELTPTALCSGAETRTTTLAWTTDCSCSSAIKGIPRDGVQAGQRSHRLAG